MIITNNKRSWLIIAVFIIGACFIGIIHEDRKFVQIIDNNNNNVDTTTNITITKDSNSIMIKNQDYVIVVDEYDTSKHHNMSSYDPNMTVDTNVEVMAIRKDSNVASSLLSTTAIISKENNVNSTYSDTNHAITNTTTHPTTTKTTIISKENNVNLTYNDTNHAITNTTTPPITTKTTPLTSPSKIASKEQSQKPSNSSSVFKKPLKILSNIPSVMPSSSVSSLQPSMTNTTTINIIPQNLHLAFIGDSVTRYQYIDLVYYLHTGRWIQNHDIPNPVREADYNALGWIYFFNHTNFGLNGKEKCDCWRGNTTRIPPKKIFEIRYYTDPIHNNYITFISKFGKIPARGHWNPDIGYNTTIIDPQVVLSDVIDDNNNSMNSNNNTIYNNHSMNDDYNFLRVFERKYEDPLWQYDWIDTIRHHIQYLQPRPKYLILNAGLWIHDFNNQTYLEHIQMICQEYNITTIYKTTASRRNENNDYTVLNFASHEVVACQVFDLCFNLSWTGDLIGVANYWDGTHFQASVNQLFNEQLLELLHNHYLLKQQ